MIADVYLGIDFSGGAAPWTPRCTRPTVWVATLEKAGALRLHDLRPVQALPGAGSPFDRLTSLLRAGAFVAAAIDAPFAIPAEHMPSGGPPALLARVAALPCPTDRPFPSGAALVAMAADTAPLRQPKPLRDTERTWREHGVNVRSTLWNGARAGAPFTAACLALLARAERPVWPWSVGPGMLVEAFPAAQLRSWGLPCSGYAKPEQQGTRERILDELAGRLSFTAAQRATMLATPDALDAVLAAFAGIAAANSGTPPHCPIDGLIAVLEDGPTLDAAGNPAQDESRPTRDEMFEDLLRRPGVRIERIVSRGATTPRGQPYLQGWDEWVLVVEGTARLALDGLGEHTLAAGDHLLIPAGVPHRVTFTANPTVWLAVHFDEPPPPTET